MWPQSGVTERLDLYYSTTYAHSFFGSSLLKKSKRQTFNTKELSHICEMFLEIRPRCGFLGCEEDAEEEEEKEEESVLSFLQICGQVMYNFIV